MSMVNSKARDVGEGNLAGAGRLAAEGAGSTASLALLLAKPGSKREKLEKWFESLSPTEASEVEKILSGDHAMAKLFRSQVANVHVRDHLMRVLRNRQTSEDPAAAAVREAAAAGSAVSTTITMEAQLIKAALRARSQGVSVEESAKTDSIDPARTGEVRNALSLRRELLARRISAGENPKLALATVDAELEMKGIRFTEQERTLLRAISDVEFLQGRIIPYQDRLKLASRADNPAEQWFYFRANEDVPWYLSPGRRDQGPTIGKAPAKPIPYKTLQERYEEFRHMGDRIVGLGPGVIFSALSYTAGTIAGVPKHVRLERAIQAGEFADIFFNAVPDAAPDSGRTETKQNFAVDVQSTSAPPHGSNAPGRTQTNPISDIDLAFAEDAAYEGGRRTEINRVRTTKSGRELLSLDTVQLNPAERNATKAVHGQRIGADHQSAWERTINAREINESALIERLWNQDTPHSRQQAAELAREAFDRHRGRFWTAVRADPALRQAFEAAGMQFAGGNTTAPFYTLPDGTRARLTLEHDFRLADDPTQALRGENLKFVLQDENSYTLEQIRAKDPFQR